MNNEQKLMLLQGIKNKIKGHYLIKDMIKEYKAPDNFIDDIPMWFSDLSVSARTDHGIIYFNNKLLEKPEELDHYALHEIKHCFQQCMNAKPTKGAGDGDYLDNKFEQEGFQAQTEYLSDTRGDDAAEKYIDKVLDHHDIDSKKERKERKKKLLHLASGIK